MEDVKEYDEQKLKYAASLLFEKGISAASIICAVVRAEKVGMLDELIEYAEKNALDEDKLDNWLGVLPPSEDDEDEEDEEEQ